MSSELRAGEARLRYDPARGGRISSLRIGELDLLVPPEVDDHNFGMFVMAPWAGRVRDGRFTFDGVLHQLPLNKPPHAIHGVARDRPWRVSGETRREVVLTTDLGSPWPFGGRVVHRLALAPDALSLRLEVHAAGQPMPASCGWHPWWNRAPVPGETLELALHADAMCERDRAGIPTGQVVRISPPPWDDCFTELGQPPAVLSWPQSLEKRALTLTLETDCPYLVVYTEPTDAVCVEPQTHPPDALNLGAARVEPGQPLVAESTWRWS